MKERKTKVLVLGAGAGGLGTACWLEKNKTDYIVVEANKGLPLNFKNGVHYLHSIPNLPYQSDIKEITMTDGVLTENKRIRHRPELQDSLSYSMKVREHQHPSSIMEIGKRNTVYMHSSNDLNNLLVEMQSYTNDDKYMFGWWVSEINTVKKEVIIMQGRKQEIIKYEFLISTLPLDFTKTFITNIPFVLKNSPINIANFKVEKIVPNWLINIYVPDPKQKVYRASILNGTMSVESVEEITKKDHSQIKALFNMFFISDDEPKCFTWDKGKVISIDPDTRGKLVEQLAKEQIISIGRFGLWNRKLLIDSTIEQSKMAVDFVDGKVTSEELTNKLR